jgi:hypothetical protein
MGGAQCDWGGKSGRPGKGFFVLARSSGRLTEPDIDQEQFWQQDLQNLYQTWRRKLLK